MLEENLNTGQLRIVPDGMAEPRFISEPSSDMTFGISRTRISDST